MENTYYLLDAEQVESAIVRKQLKHWWVAEQAGVHRTTFRRWLRGDIRHIKKENVLELARVLMEAPEVIAVPVPALDTVH